MKLLQNIFGNKVYCLICLFMLLSFHLKADITKADYKNWANCLWIKNGEVIVVVSPSFGGRILCYAIEGENIIADTFQSNGKTIPWGHQIDIVAENLQNKIEPLWSGTYKVNILDSLRVELISKTHKEYGIRLIKRLELSNNSSKLKVTNILENKNGTTRKWHFWNRTMLKPGGKGFFEIKRESIYPKGWVLFTKGKREKDYPVNRSCKRIENYLFLDVDKPEFVKIAADSNNGFVGYIKNNLLYLRKFPYFVNGKYSSQQEKMNFSIAIYATSNNVEIEPHSPWFNLKKNESYIFEEVWELIKFKNNHKPIEIIEFLKQQGVNDEN